MSEGKDVVCVSVGGRSGEGDGATSVAGSVDVAVAAAMGAGGRRMIDLVPTQTSVSRRICTGSGRTQQQHTAHRTARINTSHRSMRCSHKTRTTQHAAQTDTHHIQHVQHAAHSTRSSAYACSSSPD